MDGAETMARVSGLSLDAIHQLMAEAKANTALLAGCAGHRFHPVGPEQPLRTKWRCDACGGTVNSQARHWYELGLAHAKAA